MASVTTIRGVVTDPDVDRRPTAIALKGLLGISSTGAAWGIDALPGALQQAGDMGQIAASIVWLGCAISIVGLVMGLKGRVITGLAVEQFGLTFLGAGTALCAYALWQAPIKLGDPSLFIGMCVGLTGFCMVQWWLINRHRKRLLNEPEDDGAE
jgi:hypothetical protein